MPEKLTIAELRQHPVYLVLTERQQQCVEEFLTNGGNKIDACAAAYNCNSSESARVMSYALFGNVRVLTAIAVAGGANPDREKFKRELERAIRNPKLTIAQSQAMKLYAEVTGLVAAPLPKTIDCGKVTEPPEPPLAEHRFNVGDICLQNGKQYRVTAIDANGRPTDGEPI